MQKNVPNALPVSDASPKEVNSKLEGKVIWIVSKQGLFLAKHYPHSFHMNKTLQRSRIIEGAPEQKQAQAAYCLFVCEKKECCKKYKKKGKEPCKKCPKRG